MTDSTINAIEANIKQARSIIECGAALERLFANKDFKAVMLSGYMEKEAIRLVHLKADLNMQTPDKQQSVLTQIDAIGAVSSYFNNVRHQAMLAAKAIDADEATIEELRMGGADE